MSNIILTIAMLCNVNKGLVYKKELSYRAKCVTSYSKCVKGVQDRADALGKPVSDENALMACINSMAKGGEK